MILSQKRDVSLLLHNIRSVHNVGSIFRTADGAGVSKIFLSGYTPTPIDRFGRKRKDFAKVSLGGEESVSFEVISDEKGDEKVTDFLKKIKDDYYLVALEQYSQAVNIFDKERLVENFKFLGRKKILLILGNEVEGVGKDLLDLADLVIEIPMEGKKESLNVSIAGAIAVYFLRNL